MKQDRHIRQILDAARALRELAGINVVWKRLDGGAETGVPGEFALHCNPYCLAVKDGRARALSCVEDDNLRAAEEARRRGKPFLKTCHAGITEWVAPVMLAGQFEGLLFAGPFRLRGAQCPYAQLEKHFFSLPEFTGKKQDAIQSLLTLLAECIRYYSEWILLNRDHADLDGRIQEVLAWMEANSRERLLATDGARRCHLSLSRFLHLFKDETCESFRTVCLRLRVERAQRLLEYTRLPMADVAEETGFCSQNQFSLMFRKLAGVPPLRYRKRFIASQVV